MTIQELTQNEKYKFWYLKIKECKESDLSVQDFCERNNIKASTYYRYQQKIKTILCNHMNNETELKNEDSNYQEQQWLTGSSLPLRNISFP